MYGNITLPYIKFSFQFFLYHSVICGVSNYVKYFNIAFSLKVESINLLIESLRVLYLYLLGVEKGLTLVDQITGYN